ncbi:hypothetical protein K439DRAFT_1067761 [Ramaria rubella]|nr:hypothetical protein K439DRAFT_1067761 [Ramaria rubella]
MVPSHIKEDLSTLLVFTPPHSLLELRDEEGFASSCIHSFQRPIQQWDNVLELQSADTEEILCIWANLSYALAKSPAKGSKEFSQRQGINELLDCAFLPGGDMTRFLRLDYASVALPHLMKILVLSKCYSHHPMKTVFRSPCWH